MFVASLNFADDAGNLDRSARQLKAQTLPYDEGGGEPLIAELLRAGLFIEYEVAGKFYLHIKNFDIHQKIDRPSKGRLPDYDPSMSTRRQVVEDSTNVQRGLTPGREGKGREGNGKDQEGEKIVSASRSTRIPDNFQMNPERWKYAEGQGLNPVFTMDAFIDYWRAAAGAKARKNDWDATWRTWCRNQYSKGAPKPKKTRYEELVGPLEAAINGDRESF